MANATAEMMAKNRVLNSCKTTIVRRVPNTAQQITKCFVFSVRFVGGECVCAGKREGRDRGHCGVADGVQRTVLVDISIGVLFQCRLDVSTQIYQYSEVNTWEGGGGNCSLKDKTVLDWKRLAEGGEKTSTTHRNPSLLFEG